ncbi:hypothetical protein BKA69DRAFT_1125767 [Paraphysoderma sedebokerense]|nr:hypothetical protein BKA69DRAFT_1125767 [Paraphysoderma sedebokerense]
MFTFKKAFRVVLALDLVFSLITSSLVLTIGNVQSVGGIIDVALVGIFRVALSFGLVKRIDNLPVLVSTGSIIFLIVKTSIIAATSVLHWTFILHLLFPFCFSLAEASLYSYSVFLHGLEYWRDFSESDEHKYTAIPSSEPSPLPRHAVVTDHGRRNSFTEGMKQSTSSASHNNGHNGGMSYNPLQRTQSLSPYHHRRRNRNFTEDSIAEREDYLKFLNLSVPSLYTTSTGAGPRYSESFQSQTAHLLQPDRQHSPRNRSQSLNEVTQYGTLNLNPSLAPISASQRWSIPNIFSFDSFKKPRSSSLKEKAKSDSVDSPKPTRKNSQESSSSRRPRPQFGLDLDFDYSTRLNDASSFEVGSSGSSHYSIPEESDGDTSESSSQRYSKSEDLSSALTETSASYKSSNLFPSPSTSPNPHIFDDDENDENVGSERRSSGYSSQLSYPIDIPTTQKHHSPSPNSHTRQKSNSKLIYKHINKLIYGLPTVANHYIFLSNFNAARELIGDFKNTFPRFALLLAEVALHSDILSGKIVGKHVDKREILLELLYNVEVVATRVLSSESECESALINLHKANSLPLIYKTEDKELCTLFFRWDCELSRAEAILMKSILQLRQGREIKGSLNLRKSHSLLCRLAASVKAFMTSQQMEILNSPKCVSTLYFSIKYNLLLASTIWSVLSATLPLWQKSWTLGVAKISELFNGDMSDLAENDGNLEENLEDLWKQWKLACDGTSVDDLNQELDRNAKYSIGRLPNMAILVLFTQLWIKSNSDLSQESAFNPFVTSFAATGDADSLKTLAEGIVQLYPTYPILLYLGSCASQKAGDIHTSVTWANQSVVLTSKNRVIARPLMLHLSQLYLVVQRPDEAIPLLQQLYYQHRQSQSMASSLPDIRTNDPNFLASNPSTPISSPALSSRSRSPSSVIKSKVQFQSDSDYDMKQSGVTLVDTATQKETNAVFSTQYHPFIRVLFASTLNSCSYLRSSYKSTENATLAYRILSSLLTEVDRDSSLHDTTKLPFNSLSVFLAKYHTESETSAVNPFLVFVIPYLLFGYDNLPLSVLKKILKNVKAVWKVYYSEYEQTNPSSPSIERNKSLYYTYHQFLIGILSSKIDLLDSANGGGMLLYKTYSDFLELFRSQNSAPLLSPGLPSPILPKHEHFMHLTEDDLQNNVWLLYFLKLEYARFLMYQTVINANNGIGVGFGTGFVGQNGVESSHPNFRLAMDLLNKVQSWVDVKTEEEYRWFRFIMRNEIDKTTEQVKNPELIRVVNSGRIQHGFVELRDNTVEDSTQKSQQAPRKRRSTWVSPLLNSNAPRDSQYSQDQVDLNPFESSQNGSVYQIPAINPERYQRQRRYSEGAVAYAVAGGYGYSHIYSGSGSESGSAPICEEVILNMGSSDDYNDSSDFGSRRASFEGWRELKVEDDGEYEISDIGGQTWVDGVPIIGRRLSRKKRSSSLSVVTRADDDEMENKSKPATFYKPVYPQDEDGYEGDVDGEKQMRKKYQRAVKRQRLESLIDLSV